VPPPGRIQKHKYYGRKSEAVRALPDFALKRFLSQPAAAAAHANLSASFAEPRGMAALLALEPGAAERFAALPPGYTAAFGGEPLRVAIAAGYERVAPDEVVATCGGDDSLPSLFMALLQPGDHAIVPSPAYQPLAAMAAWCGAAVSSWEAEEAAGREPSLAALSRLLRPETRMIVTNFPHSPTGFVPDRAYLEALIAVADGARASLVGDEIYRGLPLEEAGETPSLADLSARAVVVNSVSKTLGLPGLRMGWIATRDAAVLDAVRRIRSYLNSFIPAPSEFLASIAVRHADRIFTENLILARDNLGTLRVFLERHGDRFAWVLPRGGVTAFPRWLGEESTTALSERLLRDHGLLLVPSAHFGGGERHARVGFGTAGMAAGLALLEEALAA
jgi:aspartate/methionine/tyrosine aminotransferase